LAGHVRRVVVDSDGVIVNMGRLSRLYTGSARTAAKLLVRRCQRPGCELPADFSQVDHNDEWNEHGSTDQNNAGVMCGADNRQKHRRRWKRKRATNGNTYTIRADGTIMLPVGARTPTFPNDDEIDIDDDEYSWEDDPDEIERLGHLARQRLAAFIARHEGPQFTA
jgi:HNH endonuclease